MKTVSSIIPSTKDILSSEELRFFHRILVIYEKYKRDLKTTRFDDKVITNYLQAQGISTPHDTVKNKIWIENTVVDYIQFKGTGNIGRRLVKFIRHAFAHNIIEKVNKNCLEERIHLQIWNINRKINDNKPYCTFDANIKFDDLKQLMYLILPKYLK